MHGPTGLPFFPEPWGHQMKQQAIGFKRKQSRPAKLIAEGCCRWQKFQKTNYQIYRGKTKWTKSKLKVQALVQDIFRHGSEWDVTHFGVVSLWSCFVLWLCNCLPPVGSAGGVWPYSFSGPGVEIVFLPWNQNHTAVHLPILIKGMRCFSQYISFRSRINSGQAGGQL